MSDKWMTCLSLLDRGPFFGKRSTVGIETGRESMWTNWAVFCFSKDPLGSLGFSTKPPRGVYEGVCKTTREDLSESDFCGGVL